MSLRNQDKQVAEKYTHNLIRNPVEIRSITQEHGAASIAMDTLIELMHGDGPGE